jgi:branched-chain amino acid transport system permease protein
MRSLRVSPKSFLLPGISLLVLILLSALPLYTRGSPYTIVMLTTIFMYVVITVGWAIFSGPTGYLSLASAAFFGVGIYTAALLGKTLQIHTSLPGLLAVVSIGALASFVLAILVGALTLRLRGVYFIIFTYGLSEFIRHFLLFWETNITGTRGRVVALVNTDTVYYIMLGIFVATMLTAYFIQRSKLGLALRSIGENEEAAAHSGVNVTLVKVMTFGVSALFMGAAGAIMATKWTYIDPYVAFNPFLNFLPVLMAIFGGLGQIYGPVIGAVVFTYLEEILTTKFPYWYMLIFGLVLIAAILYLPQGLVGLIPKLWRRKSGGQSAST